MLMNGAMNSTNTAANSMNGAMNLTNTRLLANNTRLWVAIALAITTDEATSSTPINLNA